MTEPLHFTTFDLEPIEPEMAPEDKGWIDAASYEELLRKWRFHPIGHRLFMGDTGRYYSKMLHARRMEVGKLKRWRSTSASDF
ncbi:MAG: hypothetical protein V4498_02860 [candidate division FCPU426 bacterium]